MLLQDYLFRFLTITNESCIKLSLPKSIYTTLPIDYPAKGRLPSLNLLIFIVNFLLLTNLEKVGDEMIKL